jgi:hypothetical protein
MNPYKNVSVSVSLGQASASPMDGIAYLTGRIGDDANAGTQIASTGFTFPNPTGGNVQLFSDLSLGPGTCYLVLYSMLPLAGGWRFAEIPSNITAPGVTIGSSEYYYNPGVSVFGDFPYAPGVPFLPTFPNEKLVFSVEGDPLSQAAVPEPSAVCLMLPILIALWVKKDSPSVQ